tara:strand:- start:27 stop:200 length:174 start_codon:yes stop_codon:yes gene_type:complete
MITVKKEHLERYIGSTRLTLGEMKQGQLESVRAIHGDKYFETTKPTKKTKISDTSDS